MKRVFAAIVVVALLGAACGSDEGDAVASLADDEVAGLPTDDGVASIDSTTDGEPNDEEALLAFTACMRNNGVEIGDPTVDAEGNLQLNRPAGAGGGNFDREAAQTAFGECGELLDGVALGFRDIDFTELEDQLLVFASCMRDNGVDMADPDLSNVGPGQGGGGPFGEIDQDDPVVQAAFDACEDSLPGFGGGFGGRAPGGGSGGDNG